jgi:hypothetical protein
MIIHLPALECFFLKRDLEPGSELMNSIIIAQDPPQPGMISVIDGHETAPGLA